MEGCMLFFLLALGVYLTLKSGFFQVKGISFTLKNTVGSLFRREPDRKNRAGISPFQAVTTALAGTMGVGNISGVATALVAGGPGAIFWMWIGAFTGMMTKYAEIFLAVRHRRKDASGRFYGGPMYYMEDGGMGGLAKVFALLCALCSLGIGNMTQVNSVSTAMESVFQIPPWICGIVVAVLVSLVVFGGLKRIATVTEMVIPFISIVYLSCACAYLVIHRSAVPEVFQLILSEAFQFRSTAAGLAGYGVRQAVTAGISRGVFTNEAGLGSAPIAHAAADSKSPAHQGVWGIFEVFLDTILVCTITAVVVLIAGNGSLWQGGLDGAALTSAAFAGTFGRFGSFFVASSLLFFAIPAMLGWCYYGEAALRYLFPAREQIITGYRWVFVCCVFLGAVMELTTVWKLSDYLNALMAIPNVVSIFILRHEIRFPEAGRRSTAKKRAVSS